jgi:hypothetical protein
MFCEKITGRSGRHSCSIAWSPIRKSDNYERWSGHRKVLCFLILISSSSSLNLSTCKSNICVQDATCELSFSPAQHRYIVVPTQSPHSVQRLPPSPWNAELEYCQGDLPIVLNWRWICSSVVMTLIFFDWKTIHVRPSLVSIEWCYRHLVSGHASSIESLRIGHILVSLSLTTI